MLPLARAAAAFIIVEAFFTRPGASLPWSVLNPIGVGIAPRGWLWLLTKEKRRLLWGGCLLTDTAGYISPTGHFLRVMSFSRFGNRETISHEVGGMGWCMLMISSDDNEETEVGGAGMAIPSMGLGRKFCVC